MHDNIIGPLKPIKWYKDLSSFKGRLEGNAFLVEGTRAIKQVINNNPDDLIEIISSSSFTPYPQYPYRQVTDRQLSSISSTISTQGIIALIRLPAEIYSDRLPINPGSRILMLEDIQDPGNVGTLIRSAVAFGYSGIILTEKCADPLSPKCVQSTAGTVLSLWIRRTSSYRELVNTLLQGGYPLIATELKGRADISSLKKQGKMILALGNEASGLSEWILKAADYRLKIPIVNDKAESLNVAACGAICMYLSSCKD